MWQPDSFLALPEDVIAFAWSAPMRDLAKTIGISDVGLKKLLRTHDIVTPPQGHWNRVRAGRSVSAPPGPPARGPGASGRVRLDQRFRGHVPEAAPIAETGPFLTPLVPEDLAELRQLELESLGRVGVPRDLSRPPAGMAKLLRKEAERREKAATSRWSSDEPHFDGPLAQRQLRLLAGLLRTLVKRGHSGEVWEDTYALRVRCKIGDETLGLRFEILGRHRTELRAGFERPAPDLPARTPLQLKLDRALRTPLVTSWQDTPERALETQMAEITADLVVAAEASFRQGLVEAREREEEHRRWLEERRQERLRQLSDKRLADLRTSGELLRRADEIRTLVARVEKAVLEGEKSDVPPEKLVRWKEWALRQADTIDPVVSGQVMEHLYVSDLDDAEGNLP